MTVHPRAKRLPPIEILNLKFKILNPIIQFYIGNIQILPVASGPQNARNFRNYVHFFVWLRINNIICIIRLVRVISKMKCRTSLFTFYLYSYVFQVQDRYSLCDSER